MKRLFRIMLPFLMVTMLVSLAAVPASAQIPQTTIPGSSIPQFVDPLPSLKTIIAGTGQIELQMTEFKSMVLPSTTVLPGNVPYTGTWVWGYRTPAQVAGTEPTPSYLGPVIVATRGQPTEIKFVNNLGTTATTNVLAYKNSVDQTLHWADPLHGEMNMGAHSAVPGQPPMAPWDQNYTGPIPAVPHLHGGEVPPVLDGGPDAWFLSQAPDTTTYPDAVMHGHGFYSKDGNTTGNYAIYRYPNVQQAAPIWFHDHTLGATRLNVYMGLAGGYLVIDPNNPNNPDPTNLNFPAPKSLPGPADIVPLVLQDRMFDTNGQLFFPSDALGGTQYSLTPERPYWVPEFVGDTIVVNGKAWPYKNVEPKRYRFLVLNGSNARTYQLNLSGQPIWVIGNDGGYLDKPAKVTRLLIQPGERYEVIIDFRAFAGTNVVLTNTAPTPYPGGEIPDPATLGKIVQFRVSSKAVVDNSYNPAFGTPLRTGTQTIVRLTNPTTGTLAPGVTPNLTRALTLNEVMEMPMNQFPGGPTEILVNNTYWTGKRIDPATGNTRIPIPGFTPVTINGFTDYLSELPNEGATEVWELINLTADAHPIHLHLTQFQILNRQAFNVANYMAAYDALFPPSLQIDPNTLQPYAGGVAIAGYGPPLAYTPSAASGNKYGGNPDVTPYLSGWRFPPGPQEAGWKDTVIALPGTVTRIAVRWAPEDKAITDPNLTYPFDPAVLGHGFVWHCHIVDHEDNEMMRPDQIQPKPGAIRTYNIGPDY